MGVPGGCASSEQPLGPHAGGRLTGAEHGGQTGAQMALGALWHPVGPSSFFFRLAFRRATLGPTGVSGWRGKPFFLLGGEALALGFGLLASQASFPLLQSSACQPAVHVF